MSDESNIIEGTNGLSYDFGVQIGQGTVNALTRTVAAATALAGVIYSLASVTTQLDENLMRNQIAFGGYANTLKAIHFASEKIVEGKALSGNTEELLAGMRHLQAAGLDAKKYFDLVDKSANAAYMSFDQMANAIRTGDFQALANVGIITDRTAQQLDRMGYSAQQSTRKMLELIKAAEGKGLFENTIKTFPQILRRFKEIGVEFVKAIVGDPLDPNSLSSTLKRAFSKAADFLAHNLDKIKFIGGLIGQTVKFIFGTIGDFIKRVWNSVSSVIRINENFWNNYEERLRSFGLWLGILRAKINHFFDEYGKSIKKFLLIAGALVLLYKIGGWITQLELAFIGAGGGAGILGSAVNKLIGILSQLLTPIWFAISTVGRLVVSIARLAFAFATSIPSIAAFAAALWATGIPEIVIAITALVAGVVLLIRNFDKVRETIGKIPDVALLILAAFMPLIGIPLLIIKHWETFKTAVINIWNIIVNVIKTAILSVIWIFQRVADVFLFVFYRVPKRVINQLIGLFKFVGNWIKENFSPVIEALGNAFTWVWDGIKRGAEAVWKVVKPIFDGAKWVVNNISKLFKRGADATSNAVDYMEKQTGVNLGGGQDGVTKKEVTKDTSQKKQTTPTKQTVNNYNAETSFDYTKQYQPVQTGNVIESGAVQINLGNQDIDEAKLAAIIQKILNELMDKDDVRKGN